MAAFRARRVLAPLAAGALLVSGAVIGIDRASDQAAPTRPAPTSEPSSRAERPPGTDPRISERTVSMPLRKARRIIRRGTNAARAEQGLPRLRATRRINRVAQRWTRRMAGSATLSHNPKVGSQIAPGWTTWAENVAYGYDERSVVTGWMNSTGHRENILRDVSHIGIGVAYTDSGTPYYTQVFARY